MPPTDAEDSNEGRRAVLHQWGAFLCGRLVSKSTAISWSTIRDLRKGARGRASTMEEGNDDEYNGDNGNNLTMPLTVPYAHGVQWWYRCCSKGTSLVGKGGGEERGGTEDGVGGHATLLDLDD
jgi:hypothetical protein